MSKYSYFNAYSLYVDLYSKIMTIYMRKIIQQLLPVLEFDTVCLCLPGRLSVCALMVGISQ